MALLSISATENYFTLLISSWIQTINSIPWYGVFAWAQEGMFVSFYEGTILKVEIKENYKKASGLKFSINLNTPSYVLLTFSFL